MAISQQERAAILRDVQMAWVELRNALRGLSAKELTDPGTVGTWSFKDMMIHITGWERILMERIQALERGEEPEPIDEADVDRINAEIVARHHDEPLDEVQREFEETHQRLVDLLERTPVLTRELVAGDTYEHYQEHLRDVLDFVRGHTRGRQKHAE